ncbi:hypothetical protein QQS21_009196 [Conoideocrella luteorostrata]|uniref:Uncharacterized protein n=1 Tax=Conoideocrella luteorostrata TaxID=1105319 RepID=A0AAJ0CLS6_9HYPO|nr:hypothetical protein QQS21_009196 [Conoideocrella luteorostrata]
MSCSDSKSREDSSIGINESDDDNFDETVVDSTSIVAADDITTKSVCDQDHDIDGDSAKFAGPELNFLVNSHVNESESWLEVDDYASPLNTTSSERTTLSRAQRQLLVDPPPDQSQRPLLLLSPARSYSSEAIDAIQSCESAAGLDFISRQSVAYERIFREACSPMCACQQHEEHEQRESSSNGAFSIKRMSQWVQSELGGVKNVLQAA